LIHIMLLQQCFSTNSLYYEIGRRLVLQGGELTVVTDNTRLGVSLNGKRIGLMQLDGMAVIVYNNKYNREDQRWKRFFRLLTYARWASKQGRNLPRPRLILAAAPPFSSLIPGYFLSRHYRVPLVLEVEEHWIKELVALDRVSSSTLLSLARRLEQKAYRQASRILTFSAQTEEELQRYGVASQRIARLQKTEDMDNLYQQYIKCLGLSQKF